MAKVRFNLHNPKERETRIRLVFRYDGLRLVYYTGDMVRPDCFNSKEGRMRRTAQCRNADQINEGLRLLEAETERVYLDYRNRGAQLTAQRFKEELDAFWKGRTLPASGPVELLPFLEQLIGERRAGGQFSPNTVKTYVTVLNKLKAYQAESRRAVTFEKIDLDFHAKFVAWLTAGGSRPNTVHKIVKTVKAVLSVAFERGLTTNTAFRLRSFTARQEDTFNIYLTESELECLGALDLSDREGMDRVRDLFLIGCYTGLRFSDLSTLSAGHITTHGGVEMFVVKTQKTGAGIAVPVFPTVRAILDKRGGAVPAAYSNQKMNTHLKEVCRLAGIDSPVLIERAAGGMTVQKPVAKWSLVSTHTARRSFATNAYLRAVASGQPIRPIMVITGHKTEREFFKYIRVDALENAALFAAGRVG